MPPKIDLSASEERVLKDILRCVRKEERFYRRAQAVLLFASGRSIRSIAVELGTCRSRVRGWLHRFRERRLEGLGEAGRPGRPAKFTPGLKQQILEVALKSPRDFGIRRDRWTGETLRETILSQGWTNSISQSSLWRLLSEAEIRLDGGESDSWQEPDESLDPALHEVADLLDRSASPDGVLSFGIKSLAKYRRAFAWNPAASQEPPPSHVVACLDVKRKQVSSLCLVRRSDPSLRTFWSTVFRGSSSEKPHMFLDAQDERVVAKALQGNMPENLHVVSSKHSWINQIEPWFSTLSVSLEFEAASGRRGSLQAAISTFTTNWNLQAAS